MGLLATLGLDATVAMRKTPPPAAAMVDDDEAGPARGAESAPPPPAGLSAPASQADAWAVDPSEPTSIEFATSHGTYFVDWMNVEQVRPWVEDTLAAFPSAKAAHAAMVKAAATLAKAKRVVEAQPHTAGEIRADVTRHADGGATDAAETAETSKNLTQLVLDQAKAARRDLIEVQKEWDLAASRLRTAGDREEAARLREEVAAEKEKIDQVVKMLSELLDAGMKGASGAGAVEYIGMTVAKVVEAIHLVNGRERLERAERLEKAAKAAAMAELAQAVRNAASRFAACTDALAALERDLAAFREDQVRQRDRAALAFDKGSKHGKFRMKELVKAMKAAEALGPAAEAALRDAGTAARAAGALARNTPQDTARGDENRAVIDAMLREARQWKQAAEQEAGRAERLLLLWSSLCDEALAAMVEASGNGRSLAQEFALE